MKRDMISPEDKRGQYKHWTPFPSGILLPRFIHSMIRTDCLTLNIPVQQTLLCLREGIKSTLSTEVGDGGGEKEGKHEYANGVP